MFNRINGIYTFKHIFYRIIHGILTALYGKSLMAKILKRNNLLLDLILCKLFACDVLILKMIRAIQAAVYAVVGKIERCENNNSVAIKCKLYFLSQLEYLFINSRIVARQQNRSLPMRKAFAEASVSLLYGTCLFEYFLDKSHIVFVLVRVFQRFEDFLMVNKFLCL